MKTLTQALMVLALYFTATSAFAFGGSKYCNPGDGKPAPCFTCAPQVLETNVQTVDQTLIGLSNQPNFAHSEKFRQLVGSISTQSTEKKLDLYFAMVGIDSENSDQLIEFISARSVPQRSIQALMQSADLDAIQAKEVASTLSQKLRGPLR